MSLFSILQSNTSFSSSSSCESHKKDVDPSIQYFLTSLLASSSCLTTQFMIPPFMTKNQFSPSFTFDSLCQPFNHDILKRTVLEMIQNMNTSQLDPQTGEQQDSEHLSMQSSMISRLLRVLSTVSSSHTSQEEEKPSHSKSPIGYTISTPYAYSWPF